MQANIIRRDSGATEKTPVAPANVHAQALQRITDDRNSDLTRKPAARPPNKNTLDELERNWYNVPNTASATLNRNASETAQRVFMNPAVFGPNPQNPMTLMFGEQGWQWRGRGAPGSNMGSWYNPRSRESLYNDMNHPPPIPPHYDYRHSGSGDGYRLFPNDTWWSWGIQKK